MLNLLALAQDTAAMSLLLRGRYRRRSHPGDADRRRALDAQHMALLDVAEKLRRERIRASRTIEFGDRWGPALQAASERVKRERYKTYRMLNPGGKKWTQ